MDLPVVFALDRAGIVGEDGETHQGAFDISYLRAIPNMTLFAPRDEKSFHHAMEFASEYEHPCSLRYPRGAFISSTLPESVPFELGKSQLLQESQGDTLFIGYGNGVGRAYETAQLLDEEVSILDLRFVKPLDTETLKDMAKKHKKWFVFSDSAKMGGVASAISEFLADEKILEVNVVSFEYSDAFITHGNTKLVEKSLGLLPEQLAQKVKSHSTL
jgi:1-deoxy-D-xylulose-5-phosphate synthase